MRGKPQSRRPLRRVSNRNDDGREEDDRDEDDREEPRLEDEDREFAGGAVVPTLIFGDRFVSDSTSGSAVPSSRFRIWICGRVSIVA